MRILILGGYGFLGQHMAASLTRIGHEVTCTSRQAISPPTASGPSPWQHAPWDGKNIAALLSLLTNQHVVINLIGANIGKKRWSQNRKQQLLQSRIKAIKALAMALYIQKKEQNLLPQQVIQASACGYYGLWKDCHTAPVCTEQSPQYTQGFLPEICAQWEKHTDYIQNLGIKTCILRFAPVLGRAWHAPVKHSTFEPSSFDLDTCTKSPLAGMLASMIPPFHMYLGGVLGSGNQPISWIHIFDVAQITQHIVEKQAHGIYNICSPYPASMHNFVHDLALCLHKPAFLHIPSRLVRLGFGQMAHELLLQGQKCIPQKLLQEGYTFRFTRLTSALNDCLCQEDLDFFHEEMPT